jgi:hypothetical protein
MAGLATTMRTHNGQEPTIRPMVGAMAAALIKQDKSFIAHNLSTSLKRIFVGEFRILSSSLSRRLMARLSFW